MLNDIFTLRAIIKSYLILDSSLFIIKKIIFHFIKLFKIFTSHRLYLILIVLHQISGIHECIRHISPTALLKTRSEIMNCLSIKVEIPKVTKNSSFLEIISFNDESN